jgi:ATP-binding cassette subfamily C protein LapB
MMAGLVEPTGGRILADGVELRQLTPAWWRSQISYVPQDVVFLDGSIGDNLRMACPELDDTRLRDCLVRADVARFVDEWPEGLEFQLREGGRNLAPGLRKRLALARALAVDGALVIMDEPTEGLDRDGVKLVFDCLAYLLDQHKTLIIFTHDPVIIEIARHCLNLDQAKP